MKKVKSILMFTFILTVFAIVFCFNTSAAEDVSSGADSTANQSTWIKRSDNIEYNFNEETGVMVIRGKGEIASGDFCYCGSGECHRGTCGCCDADPHDGLSGIPAQARWDADETRILIVENGIETLGVEAFGCFKKLETVILPDSITVISEAAFVGLKNLKTVVLPSNLKVIEWDAFLGCENLKTINFPSTLEHVKADAFYGCNYDYIKIPDTVKNLEAGNKLVPDDLKSVWINADNEWLSVNWHDVNDANGYRAYKYADGKWQKLEDIFDDPRGYYRFSIKDPGYGTKYILAVRPFNAIGLKKNSNGKYTYSKLILANNYKKITVTTPPKNTELKVTATQTTSSVTLKWNKIAGATDYRIYAYRKGAWKKLTDTSSLTYTEKKLNSGSTYKYRIEPLHKFEGDIVWSTKKKEIETSTKPATSTLKVSSTAKNKAVLNWSNPAGENGFEIYYSTKKDSGFKKYTTTKANVKKATVSKLTSGKTYYFKVRSFKTTKSGKAYSAYSAVKSVKIK